MAEETGKITKNPEGKDKAFKGDKIEGKKGTEGEEKNPPASEEKPKEPSEDPQGASEEPKEEESTVALKKELAALAKDEKERKFLCGSMMTRRAYIKAMLTERGITGKELEKIEKEA